MKIEAVDLTTGITLTNNPLTADPERTFRIAGAMNLSAPTGSESKVEVYPIKFPRYGRNPAFDDLVGLAQINVTLDKLQGWSKDNEVDIARIHLPWMYNWAEIRHQLMRGDWFPTFRDRIMSFAQIYALGPARNGDGMRLAEELTRANPEKPVGVNIHPNTYQGLFDDGSIAVMREKKVYPILIENSIDFNSPIQPDRVVLEDPRAAVQRYIVDQAGKEGRADGLLLAADHLFGIWPQERTREDLDEKLELLWKILEDPRVHDHIMAVHLTLPNRGMVRKGDELSKEIMSTIKMAKSKQPVRVALDFQDREFQRQSLPSQARQLVEIRDDLLAG